MNRNKKANPISPMVDHIRDTARGLPPSVVEYGRDYKGVGAVPELIAAALSFASSGVCGLIFWNDSNKTRSVYLIPLSVALAAGLLLFRRRPFGRVSTKRGRVLKLIAGLFLIFTFVMSVYGVISININDNHVEFDHRLCRDNLLHIWNGLNSYAVAHNGKYPDTLAELIRSDPNMATYLICPGDTELSNIANSINIHSLGGEQSSYWYLRPPEGNSADPSTVIIYELPGHHGSMFNVLFLGGDMGTFDGEKGRKVLAQLRFGNYHPNIDN